MLFRSRTAKLTTYDMITYGEIAERSFSEGYSFVRGSACTEFERAETGGSFTGRNVSRDSAQGASISPVSHFNSQPRYMANGVSTGDPSTTATDGGFVQ